MGVTELESAGIAVLSGAPEQPMVELAHPLFSEVTLAEMAVATGLRWVVDGATSTVAVTSASAIIVSMQ